MCKKYTRQVIFNFPWAMLESRSKPIILAGQWLSFQKL
jgi:hypothetical protein